MIVPPQTVVAYRLSVGRIPFNDWLHELRDQNVVARIFARLGRVRRGDFGDCKSVGEGVSELRLDFGPGYPKNGS